MVYTQVFNFLRYLLLEMPFKPLDYRCISVECHDSIHLTIPPYCVPYTFIYSLTHLFILFVYLFIYLFSKHNRYTEKCADLT